MNKNLLTAITVLLALLMWYSHADIFIRLEEYNGKQVSGAIMALNTFLAIGFSGLTAICVRHIKEYKYAAGFAAFDGTAIFFHFQSNIPPYIFNWIGSIYLALLMYFLVSMIWKLADMQRAETETKRINETETKRINETETKRINETAIKPITKPIPTRHPNRPPKKTIEPISETQIETITETPNAIAIENGNDTDLELWKHFQRSYARKTADEIMVVAETVDNEFVRQKLIYMAEKKNQ